MCLCWEFARNGLVFLSTDKKYVVHRPNETLVRRANSGLFVIILLFDLTTSPKHPFFLYLHSYAQLQLSIASILSRHLGHPPSTIMLYVRLETTLSLFRMSRNIFTVSVISDSLELLVVTATISTVMASLSVSWSELDCLTSEILISIFYFVLISRDNSLHSFSFIGSGAGRGTWFMLKKIVSFAVKLTRRYYAYRFAFVKYKI